MMRINNMTLKNLVALLLLTVTFTVQAAEYNLVIQPIQSPEKTRKAFEPLAEYLSKETGHTIKLVTSVNFVDYWQRVKAGEFDLVLDAAHFTDYRIKKMNYVPLVKILDVVSFSLVTHEDRPVLEPRELIGKKVAVLSSPSLDALRLAAMFKNPMRQPRIVRIENSVDAARLLQQKKVAAAMIPTRMVGAFPFLSTVESTPQVPHMALSASPRVPKPVQDKIRTALLKLSTTDSGKKLLADKLNLEGFEVATAKQYNGFSQLLKSVFGY